MAKVTQSATYQIFIGALRSVVAAKSPADFPRLIVISGTSGFLHMKACQAIKAAWNELGVSEAQSIEATDLDQAKFTSLWSQVSLFEPESLYILRRAAGVRSLASWLAFIKTPAAIKSRLVLDCGEKIPADVVKQVTRLGGVVLNAVEPVAMGEFQKVAQGMARKAGLNLDDDALGLLVESMGLDLGKIENEILNLSLQFHGVDRQLSRADIAGSIGALREDDVFELFSLLRERRSSSAHLMTGNFIGRGESAIAITGIFARYAREQIERGSARRGISGLMACAEADRRLKSSRMDDALVLSGVIDAISEV